MKLGLLALIWTKVSNSICNTEKDKPTNVLSFQVIFPKVLPMLDALPLGDLVICIPVVEQKKTAQNHFASVEYMAFCLVMTMKPVMKMQKKWKA